MVFIFYLYRHIALFTSFISLCLWLYWSLYLSAEVFACEYNWKPVGLCLTVTNLSSLLNSLRDLPENATSLLLGSLLHIEGAALNCVCVRERVKVRQCAARVFLFVAPTVKPNLWHQKQLHNYFTSLVWWLWGRKKEIKKETTLVIY